MPERILVVDDDNQITEFLQRFLRKQGYEVATAGSATQMGLRMEHQEFDIVLLDVGLPDVDGFQVLRELRKNSSIPIILLTVRNDVYDKIVGLEIGADDYVSKPFEPRELLARMRAVLRRSFEQAGRPETSGSGSVRFSGFTLTYEKRVVTDPEGVEVPLTSMEFTLLASLVQHPGQTVTRESLMSLLYGNSIHVTDRAVDAHMSRLRRKLENAGGHGGLIKTVHGKGYCLADELRQVSE